jgi:hypothetical protein
LGFLRSGNPKKVKKERENQSICEFHINLWDKNGIKQLMNNSWKGQATLDKCMETDAIRNV